MGYLQRVSLLEEYYGKEVWIGEIKNKVKYLLKIKCKYIARNIEATKMSL
jgi:uncharacterized protein with ATP-grasp and redox domains